MVRTTPPTPARHRIVWILPSSSSCWSGVSVCYRVEGYRSLDFNLFTLRVAAFLGIVAAGQTLVILMGGIDLSVAAVVTMAGVIGRSPHHPDRRGRAASGHAGDRRSGRRLQRAGRVVLRLPPLVMTLASLSIIQGVLLVYNAGKPVSGESHFLELLGQGQDSGCAAAGLGAGRGRDLVVVLLALHRVRQGDLRHRQ